MSPPDLHDSASYYRSLFEAAGDAIIVIGANGDARDCNQAALELLACTRDQLLGTTPLDWSPEFQPCGSPSVDLVPEILARAAKGEAVRFEWVNIRADGKTITVDVSVRPLLIGGESTFVVIIRDITALKNLAEEHRLAEEKFSQAFLVGPDPIIFSEISTGLIRQINPAFTEIFGYTESETLGRTTLEIGLWVDERQRQRTVELMREKGQLRNHEVDFRTKDGRLLTVLGSAARLELNQHAYWLVQFRDITEIKALRTELEYQAHVDYITGLATRRYFLELANGELARAQRYGNALSMLMVDLDHFKQFNDSCGHLAGDEALRQISGLCQEILRTPDIIGRFGGEEFAILLPETNIERALEVAARLRESVAHHPIPCGKHSPKKMTISIGITEMTPADTSLDDLFARADIALYRAKRSGRNRVCCEPIG